MNALTLSPSLKILIQLVGAQAQPNVLCLKTIKPNVVINLYTSKTKATCGKIRDFSKEYFPQIDCRCIQFKTPEPSVQDTQNLISECIESYATNPDNKIIINYTGGTKPMAIGAFLAGKDNHTLVYFIDAKTLKEGVDFHDCQWSPQALTIEEILNIEGKKIKHESIEYDFNILKDLARECLNIHTQEKKFSKQNEKTRLRFSLYPASLERVWDLKNKNTFPHSLKYKVIPHFEELMKTANRRGISYEKACELCCKIGWLEHARSGSCTISPKLNTYEKLSNANNFLDGGWWEVIVATALEEILGEEHVRWSVKTQNVEDDVLGVFKNRLLVVSCKAGYEQKKFLTELNNLAKRADILGGKNAIPVFARYGALKDEFVKHAKEEKILLITEHDTTNINSLRKKLMEIDIMQAS